MKKKIAFILSIINAALMIFLVIYAIATITTRRLIPGFLCIHVWVLGVLNIPLCVYGLVQRDKKFIIVIAVTALAIILSILNFFVFIPNFTPPSQP